MGETASVSVIIPTHNRLQLLAEAIRSVRSQTLPPLEIIVVDDGSVDGTWPYLIDQPLIRCLRHNAARGPSAARNAGAALAQGTFLAFLDSDDLFAEEKLHKQMALLETDPDAALCHCDERWLFRGRPKKQLAKHEKRGGWIFEHCLPLCRISPSAVVVRREVFFDLGGFDEELQVAEDYELWLRLTCRHRVAFVPEPLVIKRGGHPGQLSAQCGPIEAFRIEALRRVLLRAPLRPDQRRAALRMLRDKCEIYARGCQKRGRLDEARFIRALPETLQSRTSTGFDFE